MRCGDGHWSGPVKKPEIHLTAFLEECKGTRVHGTWRHPWLKGGALGLACPLTAPIHHLTLSPRKG